MVSDQGDDCHVLFDSIESEVPDEFLPNICGSGSDSEVAGHKGQSSVEMNAGTDGGWRSSGTDGGWRSSEELFENMRILVQGQQRLEILMTKLVRSSDDTSPLGGASEAVASGWGVVSDSGQDFQSSPKARTRRSSSVVSQVQQTWTATRSVLPSWHQHLRLRSELTSDGEQLARELRNASGVGFGRTASRKNVDVPLVARNAKSRWIGSRGVLSPTSSMRAMFDLCSIVVLVYEVTSAPYLIAFDHDSDISSWLAYASVGFWTLDIFVNFRTGIFKHGELIMEPSVIGRHYLRSGFFLDLLVVIMDIVAIVLDLLERSAVAVKLLRISKISRGIRMARIVRLRRLRGAIASLNMQRRSIVSPITRFFLETCSFLLLLVWSNHFVACLWCYLAREWGQYSDTGITWLDMTTGGQAYHGLGEGYQYTTALHFVMSQMTPGSMQVFPQNSTERVFNLMCLVAGLLVFSTLISSISATVTSFRIQMQSHNSKMDALNIFLGRHRICPELRLSIVKQVQAKLDQARPPVVTDLVGLDKISLSLRNALYLELGNPHLLQHAYFGFLSAADPASWGEICRTCVDFSGLVADETLFLEGAKAVAMYFVMSGQVRYTLSPIFAHGRDEETPPADVEPGRCLCEAAIWCHWRHVGSAEVPTGRCCELLSLGGERVLRILSISPLNAALTCAYARSFHALMMQACPPLCSQPNDLDQTFAPDEAIASMPKEAAVFIGQVAIGFLQQPRDTLLGSYLPTIRKEKHAELMEEVSSGQSTLVVSAAQEVVRCVRLVALKLTHPDGRILLQTRLTEGADGSAQVSCMLPGGRQEVGENFESCLNRLLEERLLPLSDCLDVSGLERQTDVERTSRFGVPTNYTRTVISADWQHRGDAELSTYLLGGCAMRRPTIPGFGRDSFAPASAQSRTPTVSSQLTGADDFIDAAVYRFPQGDVFTWASEEEFHYFKSTRGKRILLKWLQDVKRHGELTDIKSL